MEVELRHSADGDYQRSGTIESLRDGKMLLMKEHELHRIPMENVLRIEINNRAMGVRDGFVVGLLLSAVIAGLLYRSCGYCTPTARAASLFAILDLSFVIGPSVAIGGAIGHRTILDFENR